MRVFTCLSKNVSMALDMSQRLTSSDRRPKNRLNFRTKKRRAIASTATSGSTTSIGGTPSKKHTSSIRNKNHNANDDVIIAAAPKSVCFQDSKNSENIPPPPSISKYSTGSASSNVTTASRPLPAIPPTDLDISVYIKELDSDDDVENNSDYLPLAHIAPPLTEGETTASSSSPSPLQPQRHYQRRHYKQQQQHSDYTTTTSGTSTTSGHSSMDVTSSSPTSLSSQNIYQQIPEVTASSMGSSTISVSNIKSVGSLNEAFVQSAASLPRLRNILSSTRLDDCTNCAVKRVQKKVTTATASTSTTDIKPLMTYSRRKAAYALNPRNKRQRPRTPESDDFYSNEAALLRRNNSYSSRSSRSSRVEEVSDLLEASVAEYNSYQRNTVGRNTRKTHMPASAVSSSRGTNRRTDYPVEVCDNSDDNNDNTAADNINNNNNTNESSVYQGQTTHSQTEINVEDLTQTSQFTNGDLTQYSHFNNDTIATTATTTTGLYSQLVDYTASATTLPSGAEADGESQAEEEEDFTQEETRFYENEIRPLRLCEGESQTSLVSSKGIPEYQNQHHPHRLRHHCPPHGVGAYSIDSNNVTAYNSDYSQVNNVNYNTYNSQSSLPSYLGETETELTADYYDDTTSTTNNDDDCVVASPSYVNVSPRECSRLADNDDETVVTDDNDSRSDSRASEFLGCMSFGVPNLLKKDLDGWYYLLTEEVGRKKHLQAKGTSSSSSSTATTTTTTTTRKPVLTSRGPPNVPIPNMSVEGQEKTVITVLRGKSGFGFSFVDELPPKIGRVDKASPAEQAGIKKGDSVISINGKNVSRSTSKGVAHLVKQMKAKSLTLELQRDYYVIPAPPTSSTTSTSTSTSTATAVKRSVGTTSSSTSTSHNNTDHLYESIMGTTNAPVLSGSRDHYNHQYTHRDHHKENRRAVGQHQWLLEEDTAQTEDDFVTEDEDCSQAEYYNDRRPSYHGGSMPNLKALTSTPMPRAARIQRPVSTQVVNRNRQESIHRLMSVELDFIDFMHYGIERYSRPLRHCIISAPQHGTMFQNVEKLVTISEFHIKQMQETAPSVNSEDTDDSQSSENSAQMFPNSVALIYQSKIHMLCQAYESYTHGLRHSNQLLRELRSNRDFINFIKDPSSSSKGDNNVYGGSMFGHPSISAFINRPVQHINDLYTVFSEIFAATSQHSPDYPVLHKISTKLAQCITAITNLSSAGRVHSLDSLTSSQGCSTSQTTSSGKGSMASLASCSSAETEALRPMRPPPPPPSTTSTTSLTSQRPVDPEVARVQERLVFPPHIPTFQLCQEDRHIIFRADIYRFEQGNWFKSHLLLLSDLLLLLDTEPSGMLRVVDTPFYLSDLSGLEVNRKHASEFILHLHTTTPFSTNPHHPYPKKHNPHQPTTRPVVLRAPSAQEKFMWKSLLEQRVSSVSGVRLQHYGSMRDISNVKTSVVL